MVSKEKLAKFIRYEAEVLYGKGNNMDEYFDCLVERAQYYKQFEFFREDFPKVQVGLNCSEHPHKEVIVVELILKQKQEKKD